MKRHDIRQADRKKLAALFDFAVEPDETPQPQPHHHRAIKKGDKATLDPRLEPRSDGAERTPSPDSRIDGEQ